MKYLFILAIPSIVVAASRIHPRQPAQPALDTEKLDALRASSCLYYTRPDCEKAIEECGPDEAAIQSCIRTKHPTCIQEKDSPCGKTVAQCLSEFGKEADADQAVKDCIIARVVADTPDAKTQPVNETQVNNLRASHCLDHHRPECEKAILDCVPECAAGKVCKYKPNEVEYCVRDNTPTCIQDESSLCSKSVVECLSEFGQEEDADQAVSDCIIEKVISGTPDEEDQADEENQADEEDKPAAAGPKPTMSAACVKASEDFKNVLDADSHCDDTEADSTNEVRRRDSATCSAAIAAFERAWAQDGCETQLQDELGADLA